MRLLFGFAIILGLFSTWACSPSRDSQEPASTPVAQGGHKPGEGEPAKGMINGQEWTFRSGRAFAYSKQQDRYLVVQLWSEAYSNPCKVKNGSILQARLTAPFELASWTISPEDPFNSNISIFFTDFNFHPQPRDNMRADRGEISFGQMNTLEVTGYMAASFINPKVAGTSIAGDFAVPFCAYSASYGDNF